MQSGASRVKLMEGGDSARMSSHAIRERKRFYYMDALNVLACFAVMALHCSTVVQFNEGDWFWRYCVAIQFAFIFAVPIFLLISGANLLGYRERYSTKDFFKKRMSRILGVFLGCSVLIYVLQCLPIEPLGGGWRQPSLGDFATSFLSNSIENTYWYFYAIIGLYLVTPVFSRIVDDRRLLGYAIAVCATVSLLFPLVDRFTNGFNPFAEFSYPYLSSWLLYYLAGYYLNTYLKKRIPFPVLILVMLCSVAFMFVMTVHVNDVARVDSVGPVKYDSFYANALGLGGAALSISLFIAGKQLNERIGSFRFYGAIKGLSSLSLGIYAIHMLVRNTIFFFLGGHAEHYILARALMVYLATAVVVFAYRYVKARIKKVAGSASAR